MDDGLVVSESDSKDPTELCQVQDPLDVKGKAIILKKKGRLFDAKPKELLLSALLRGVFCREEEAKELVELERNVPTLVKRSRSLCASKGLVLTHGAERES